MPDQTLGVLERVASSGHAALLISLAIGVALAWGWWRREAAHSARYDKLQVDETARESNLLQCLAQREEELAALAKEAFGVLQDVSAAMAGMERTLDGVEALVHTALTSQIHGEKGPDDGKEQKR
jgi:hypothetical protein